MYVSITASTISSAATRFERAAALSDAPGQKSALAGAALACRTLLTEREANGWHFGVDWTLFVSFYHPPSVFTCSCGLVGTRESTVSVSR